MSALKYWDGTDWQVIRPQDSLSDATLNGYLLTYGLGSLGAGNAVATIWFTAQSGGFGAFNSATVQGTPPDGYFHWNPDDYPPPPDGWVRKWLMKGSLIISAAPGTITYTYGVRRFTVGGNASGISYSMITPDVESRAIQFINPAGGQSLPASVLVDPPASSHYGMYATWSTTTPAGCFATMNLRIYLVSVPG